MHLMKMGCVLIACCLLSCRKNGGSQNVTAAYVSYSHLTIGNYWIYGNYQLDSNYAFVAILPGTDSVYVDKDTMIRANIYHRYCEPLNDGSDNYQYSYLRDSLSYIVDYAGNIVFAADDFTTIFYSAYRPDPNHNLSPADTAYYRTTSMADKDSIVNVPAGFFKTSSMRTTYYFNPAFASRIPLTRIYSKRYSQYVGMVSVMPAGLSFNPNYTQWELSRYHLQ